MQILDLEAPSATLDYEKTSPTYESSTEEEDVILKGIAIAVSKQLCVRLRPHLSFWRDRTFAPKKIIVCRWE